MTLRNREIAYDERGMRVSRLGNVVDREWDVDHLPKLRALKIEGTESLSDYELLTIFEISIMEFIEDHVNRHGIHSRVFLGDEMIARFPEWYKEHPNAFAQFNN